MEETIRSTVESVSQDVTSIKPQSSQRVYAVTDDEILSDLDTSLLATQAERETYFLVLDIQEIEESPSGSARGKDISVSSQGPEGLSAIKIIDLLNLVKGNEEKYISQRNQPISEKVAGRQTEFFMQEPVEQMLNRQAKKMVSGTSVPCIRLSYCLLNPFLK